MIVTEQHQFINKNILPTPFKSSGNGMASAVSGTIIIISSYAPAWYPMGQTADFPTVITEYASLFLVLTVPDFCTVRCNQNHVPGGLFIKNV